MAFDTDRSISTVLGQIADNIQHIVRAEVRLARVEIAEELQNAKRGAVMMAAAGAVALLGCGVILLAAVYGLALVMAPWAAALVVGIATLVIAGISASVGAKAIKRVTLPPTKVVESIQETVQWAKTRVK